MPEELLPVGRQSIESDSVEDLLFLLFLEVVPTERLFSFLAPKVEDRIGRHGEGADPVGLHSRKGDRSGGEAVRHDVDARGIVLPGTCPLCLLCPFCFRLGARVLAGGLRGAGLRGILPRRLVLPLLLVALRREEVRGGRGQGRREDPRRLRVDVGELESAERGSEVAVGEEEEVLAVGREGGGEVSREAVAERERLA